MEAVNESEIVFYFLFNPYLRKEVDTEEAETKEKQNYFVNLLLKKITSSKPYCKICPDKVTEQGIPVKW